MYKRFKDSDIEDPDWIDIKKTKANGAKKTKELLSHLFMSVVLRVNFLLFIF